MTSQTDTMTLVDTLTVAARKRLEPLRAQYRPELQPFCATELERLHFVRWLYQTGRLNESSD